MSNEGLIEVVDINGVGYQIDVMENCGGRNLAAMGVFTVNTRWIQRIFHFGSFFVVFAVVRNLLSNSIIISSL